VNASWVLWLAGAAVAFMLAVQGWMWLQSRRARGRPAPDTARVDGPAAADRVRVYYFYGVHCGHCRSMTPRVDRLRESHRNLIKLDIAEARDLAQAFGVMATPGVVQVVDGVIRRVQLGGMSDARLRALLATG
jgi:thiol-disulfide isomerase/thioredoxin